MEMETIKKRFNNDAENDEIIGVRKRYQGKLLYGYSLITKKYCNKGIHPFIHKSILNYPYEQLGGYAKLLKQYLDKHPELLVLAIILLFPQLNLIFQQIFPLNNILLKKLAF